MISPDTKDALARDVPPESHCRNALLAGLAVYGNASGEFVTHRNAVARLFWSLLDERKATGLLEAGLRSIYLNIGDID